MRRKWKFFLSGLTAAAIGLSGIQAQSRLSDKDLEALMRNLKDDAKSFRSPFESDLKKSTIRKTSREKEGRQLAERFEKDTESMLNHFKSTKKADRDLPAVRSTAQQLEAMVVQLGLGQQTTSRWKKIQTELRQISTAFGIEEPISRYENPRGINAYAASSNDANSCGAAVGMERARTLVNECLAVSPATHPPCNAANSCRMIIEEIKRGCAMLRDGAPSFCNEYK